MRLTKLLVFVGLLALALLSVSQEVLKRGPGDPSGKVDDWAYSGSAADDWLTGPFPAPTSSQSMMSTQEAGAARLGYSVGGAKDIENFRQNVLNGYLPLPTDLTHEGLFYGYYFDTGEQTACAHLFCPSYSHAVSRDPVSGAPNHYLTVGLNSGLSDADFERKTLNLVIVLDISGSMSSPFDRYYYDRFGRQQEVESIEADKSKMALAAESVVALMDRLNADDRLGMVLFNERAHLAKPLSRVGGTDMAAIRDHVLELRAGGSTNMSAGLELGTSLFDELGDVDPERYENRIIFLTDAMPNRGATDDDDLLSIAQRNADRDLYTTFIGIGVDFNTELIEAIGTVRGANYHSVHSASDFRERMDEGFEYMVTPLVFNLELTLETTGYRIAEVYGSPDADEATGRLMSVNTLFPSKTKNGETRGGVVLLKLDRLPSDERASDQNGLTLRVRYEDRSGRSEQVETAISLDEREPDYFANTGIRKAVLLARYADLLRNWLIDEGRGREQARPIEPSVTAKSGIHPPDLEPWLGRWERQSVPLAVSDHYRTVFREFRDYMRGEMAAIGDETLEREVDLLSTLATTD